MRPCEPAAGPAPRLGGRSLQPGIRLAVLGGALWRLGVLVVDKPAGMVTHPAHGATDGTRK